MNGNNSRPLRGEYASHWQLNPELVYLNHGSFGACPTQVLAEQARLRAIMEFEPQRFFLDILPTLQSDALAALARFINADQQGLTFLVNSTSGVNTVLRCLDLKPADEILLPDHTYRACRHAVDFVCSRSGAKAVIVKLPFGADADEIVDTLESGVTDRTRLALIDTVSSPTAVRMPFERLTQSLQDKGVDVLVDGSHGVGLIPLDLEKLGAAYFTGNCHKWLCTPKGSGFLYIREDRRDQIHPLVISHGYSEAIPPHDRFRAEFDWQGTQDPTPWLCVPFAIDYLADMVPGGWHAIVERTQQHALYARNILAAALNTDRLTPAKQVAGKVSVELPGIASERSGNLLPVDPLKELLRREYGIEVVIVPWPAHDCRYLRVSAALYNSREELEYLATSLPECLGSLK